MLVIILSYVVLIAAIFVTCWTIIDVIIILFFLFHNFLVFYARSNATKRSNLPLIQYQNRPSVCIGAELNALLHSVVRIQRQVWGSICILYKWAVAALWLCIVQLWQASLHICCDNRFYYHFFYLPRINLCVFK